MQKMSYDCGLENGGAILDNITLYSPHREAALMPLKIIHKINISYFLQCKKWVS